MYNNESGYCYKKGGWVLGKAGHDFEENNPGNFPFGIFHSVIGTYLRAGLVPFCRHKSM